MSCSLFDVGRNHPRNATVFRKEGKSKPSVFKRLKNLVRTSQTEVPQPQRSTSISTFEHERRAEALRSCGLLKQSVKYGAPYRDEEDDAKTFTCSAEGRCGEDTEDKKDLIIFDEKFPSGKDNDLSSENERLIPVHTPASPRPRLSVCTSSHYSDSEYSASDSSTLTPGREPIRIRRIGSLVEEIDRIEDEESRRLTEVAFLS